MGKSTPSQRIWILAASMTAAAAILLIASDLSMSPENGLVQWWMLIPAFLFTEILVIHLPTKRSAHTVSVSEFPLVIGLAFVQPYLFIVARMVGTVIAYTAFRRQQPLKLAFNTSMVLLDSTAATLAFYLVLGSAGVASPRGWLAAAAAVAVSNTLSALLVSLAIATHDEESSIRERTKQFTAGFLISMFAGVIAILWVIVLISDPLAGILLAITAVPVFMALSVYERLARRHDELGMAHALTKELDQRDTVESVSEAGIERVVETLSPEAVVVLAPNMHPVTFFEDAAETLILDEQWDETVRYHRDVCTDGGECACARRALGPKWDTGKTFRLVIGDAVRGMLIVRPRLGRGAEISESDHGMLEAIAAQLSSAMTRIEAVALLTREIEENQALVRSKDQLIASVSHELRTPLTGIIGFAELLTQDESGLGDQELESAKQYIATEAHDLGNIVEDLLTAARADLGALEVQSKPVSTSTVIDRALSHLRTDGPIDVSGPECWLLGDAPRVRQILRNLLSNAVKYGGDRIKVQVAQENEIVYVSVIDNGEGVPAERMESIFEPYESAHEEPSQPGSLGLGLSISRTLAQLMGGDLTYQRKGGHTEFRLAMPAVEAAGHGEGIAR